MVGRFIKCSECGSVETEFIDRIINVKGHQVDLYECLKCGIEFTFPDDEE